MVAKVLSALTNLSDLSLFSKMRMWELMSATVGFLYHPNVWIRQGARLPSPTWAILTCFICRSGCFSGVCRKETACNRRLVHTLSWLATTPEIGYSSYHGIQLAYDRQAPGTLSGRACSETFADINLQLPRQIFDAAVAWAMKGEKSQFWQGLRSTSGKSSSKAETGKEAMVSMKRSGSMTLSKVGNIETEEYVGSPTKRRHVD